MNTQNIHRLALSVEETRLLLGLSRGLMYDSIRKGEIPSIRVGRRILVPRVALERFLEQGSSTDSNQNGSQVSFRKVWDE